MEKKIYFFFENITKVEFFSNLSIKDIFLNKKNISFYFGIFLSFMQPNFPKIPIPTVFTWHFGGTNVYISGDWDCWQRHIPLCHSGWEFSAIIPLFPGRFRYKFSVDGKWKYAPTHKIEEDFQGTFNNIAEIERLGKYFFQNESLLDNENFPNTGILDFKFPKLDNFNKGAPLIPPHYINFVDYKILKKKKLHSNFYYFSELSLSFQVYLNHIFFFSWEKFKLEIFKKLPTLWTRNREKMIIMIFCAYIYIGKKINDKIEKEINFNGFETNRNFFK